MLKIIVNGSEVDLGNLNSITLKYNGGIFDFNSIVGSYSIPFTLPLNEINSRIFNFPYNVGSSNREVRTFDCEIWHSGLKMIEGTIKASTFNKDSISCNLEMSNGNLYKKLNEKKLNEHYYGGEKPFVMKTEYSIDDDDFLLYAVENENFCDDTEWESRWKTNVNINATEQNHFNTVFNDFTFPDVKDAVITPFPLLWRVLKYLFTYLGYGFEDNFFTTGDYKGLTIFNVNNAITVEYIDENGELKAHNRLVNVDLSNHLPEINTNDFMKSIQNLFNITFLLIGNTVKVVDRVEMFKSKEYIDITDKIVNDFSKKIIDVNSNGISFKSIVDENDLNVSTLEDLNKYPTPRHITGDPFYQIGDANEVVYSEDYKHYYRFYNQSENDPDNISENWWFKFFPDNCGFIPDMFIYVRQMPWRIGNEEIKIDNIPTSVPETIIGRVRYDITYRIPKVKMKGNSYVNKGEKNKFSFRLLYYLGMQQTFVSEYQNDLDYKMQPVARDHVNDKEISAKWAYEYRWKDFLNWYSEKAKVEFEQDIFLKASEIKNLDFSKKYKIDKNIFFIKKFSVQLTRNEIKPAKCTMIEAFY